MHDSISSMIVYRTCGTTNNYNIILFISLTVELGRQLCMSSTWGEPGNEARIYQKQLDLVYNIVVKGIN